MSYLDEVKEKVSEAKEAELESFKTFMEDFCIKQFKDTSPHPTATVYPNEITEEGVSVKHFVSWLEQEGFMVSMTRTPNGVITISYLNKE